MEIRKGTALHIAKRPAQFLAIFYFLFSILLIASGCGAPGEPVPPTPPVPVAIKDLTARQIGDGVQLAFTLPTNSVTGDRLPESPAVEILRGANPAGGPPRPNPFRVFNTIPDALVPHFVSHKHVEYMDIILQRDPATRSAPPLLHPL